MQNFRVYLFFISALFFIFEPHWPYLANCVFGG